jgi:hypothetical protein
MCVARLYMGILSWQWRDVCGTTIHGHVVMAMEGLYDNSCVTLLGVLR